ncbi:MAG: polysaccharide deacetylase family protein [Emcibacteraceae bacterium]|nr:polysaccharide deacetylase family protein [Emcibacteraceae bacterium]
MKKIFFIYSLLISLFFPAFSFAEEDSAIIIMYHKFGEENFPTTNVTLDQIDAHIAELSKDQYNIVPLKEIVDAFNKGQTLQERTIAITIDDGYLSIYQEGWPRFKEAGIPITIFISTESINDNNTNSMTWDQIRELEKEPMIDIGHHGHAHSHMAELSISDALNDLDTADQIFTEELGYIPEIFAYPYGEYSSELIKSIAPRNYTAVFGQYSSAASSTQNMMALPRFAFNESYSNLNRFKLIINSRALPVRDLLPTSQEITVNPPAIGFTVDGDINGLSSLGCFPSHMSEAATVTQLGEKRIEIRFDEPFPVGRSRLNCTMPGPDNRWYWFGLPFFNLGE